MFGVLKQTLVQCSPLPALEMWWISERDALYCPPLEGISVFWTPLLPLDVVIIVHISEAAVGDSINRFTLFLPALCSLWRLLSARKGQVCSDAVPDSVAHRVLTVVCADQLPPVTGGDGKINENRASLCYHFLPHLWKTLWKWCTSPPPLLCSNPSTADLLDLLFFLVYY